MFQDVVVATGYEERGVLAFQDHSLVGVLVRLADDNEVAPGLWFLEHGFGPLMGEHPTFADLDQAAAWLSERLGPTTAP